MSTRRRLPWVIASAVALAAVGGFWLFTRGSARVGSAANAAAGGKFHTLLPVDMDVKVRKDGELQAVENIDIVNLVEGQSTIVQLVKEGSAVRKGDVLVVLDSSEIRQKLEDGELALQKAESDLKNAKEMQRIQESQNAADLEAAEVELDLARLALREYSEGTFPEALADAQTTRKMAEITLRNKEEELEQTRSLYTKGFVTAAQVKADELTVTTVGNDLRKAETALKVLQEFTYPTQIATNKSAVSQAEQALARVQVTNAAELSQKVVATQAAEAALVTAKRKLDHLKEQLARCTIKAPADGLVVYADNDRDAQGGMAEGAQVRERQKLLRLPDTSRMNAVVRVNESQVSKLKIGQPALVKIVGVPDPVAAKVTKKSPIADSGQRWWNPDLKEYPVELTLNRTPTNCLPGMGAQVEILIARAEDTLTVPLAAIYSERNTSYVFARRGGEVVPVPVTIGQTNETHAQLAAGLSSGQQVLILQAGQGRELLERAGIRPAAPASPREISPEEPEAAQATAAAPPAKPAEGGSAVERQPRADGAGARDPGGVREESTEQPADPPTTTATQPAAPATVPAAAL